MAEAARNIVGPVTERSELELTIVMPCLNEAETLEVCVRKAIGFLERSGISGEVLVADNGSTDGSQEIAVRCGARLVHVPQRGYGAALYHGMQAARGRYLIMGDADDSYDFENLDGFVDRLRDGYDLVMGNRFQGGIKKGAMPWKNRWIGNPLLSGLGRLFFRCPAGDFHCGIRGLSKDAFRRMDLRTTGMEFASEMVIKSTLKGQRIAEIPTTLSPDGRSRPPHLKPWRDGWRHLRFMLLYSPRWLFLLPGLVMMLAGVGLGARLVAGPLHIGGVELDVHTLLYCSLSVLIGAQLLFFALFSKTYAIAEGLLPPDERLAGFLNFFSLERGLVTGVLLTAAGFIASALAVWSWGSHGFGELSAQQTLRLVIPAALALTLGVQMIFSSFFLSVLQLKLRNW